jgi:LDH2 family malate/lactate/ureidoglycolate dehydrogenase
MTEENLTISGAALRRFIHDALTTVGMPAENATTAAEVLATADEFGVATHGVKLLPGYLRRLQGGGAKPQGRPHVIRDGPAWALVDGGSSLGVLIGVFGMQAAIDKARTAGIAYVGVRNSGHFAAAGYYALMAARAGLVGISVANDTPSVIAPGARAPVVGTNPFSYAVPAGRHPPILMDMAISTVAGGKVYQSRMLGKPIPDNWIVDRDGLPTTNAELYPEQASLVPAGGYKGFGLGLLIETLAGLLSGAEVTFGIASWMLAGTDKPTHHGAAFIAIDPAVLGPREEFLERVDKLIDEIHATPTAAGVERIMVPGDREFAQQERSRREPMVLLADVAQNVRQAAEMVGLQIGDYVGSAGVE